MLIISDAAKALIESAEISNMMYYTTHLSLPTWPQGDSGVTIGIGYDLGYCTRDQFESDWGSHLSTSTIAALDTAIGIKGGMANRIVDNYRDIRIPYDAAKAVFENATLPQTIAEVASTFENTDQLSTDSLGALVSIVYNRGADCNPDEPRRTEMWQIWVAMKNKNFGAIPAYIRSMKRLWPPTSGLVARREDEAKLFEKGLSP